ncbi:MAG: hypothetical protein WCJ95_22370 [Mariniphaga sp.]
MMKNLTEKLEWIFDYYVVYFLYNPHKIERYYRYMNEKWNILPGFLPNHLKHSS